MRYKWLVAGGLALLMLVGGALTRAAAPDPAVSQFLKEMYDRRAAALVTGAPAEGLDRFYSLESASGRFALAHEAGRINYVQAWAPARRLKITAANSQVTNLRVKVRGDSAEVSLIIRTRLSYLYDDSPVALNEMGVGSWHWLQLVRKNGAWQVAKEFYLDAMGDEWTRPYMSQAVPDALPVMGEAAPPLPMAGRPRYDRPGAVNYAESYCGAAWGCGNNSDYNSRYSSYKNLGGDCANFASQVLTEGGKLRPDWVWRGDKSGSSVCWVNAQSFSHYLLSSGRATLLARGNYPKVLPALTKLKPGDIVAYQRKGTITHVSVVTGSDSAGVPVVAAHTADRFRNPWDLGWDQDTVYWLLHMRD